MDYVAALRAATAALNSEPLDLAHWTDKGPVRLVSRFEQGAWIAMLQGAGIDESATFGTLSRANAFLFDRFWHLLPKHKCRNECGPETR